MARRRRLFIGLVFLFLLLVAGGGWLYLWTQSGIVRQRLIAHLQDRFEHVDVEAGSVWWLPWGGIHVNDLRLIPRGDSKRTPFLTAHQMRIYPDKEQFSQGRVVIRKIELDRPHFYVTRGLDGTWNLAELLRTGKTADDRCSPLLQIHDAKVTVVDRRLGTEPVLQLHDVNATIINDPLPVFSVRAEGKGQPLGAFAVQGQFHRGSCFTGSIDAFDAVIDRELILAVGHWLPELKENAQDLHGKASVHLDVAAGGDGEFSPDLRIRFREGHWGHPWLPAPLEQLQFDAQYRNGDLTIDHLSGKAGGAAFTGSVDLARDPICAPAGILMGVPSRNPPAAPALPKIETSPLQEIENRLRKLEFSIQNVTLNSDLFARLPPRVRILNDMFAPSGALNLDYSYTRKEGIWNKKMIARPVGIDAIYRGFPYPMKRIRGTIEYAVNSFTESQPDSVALDLTAEGCGTTVGIKGSIKGSSPDLDVDLVITGKGITLDKQLVAALPDDNPRLIERLHAEGYGDFSARIRHNERIRREHGPDVFDNLFTIHLRNGSVKYDEFPYELQNLSGTLIIRTVPVHPTQLPPALGMIAQKSFGDTGVLEFIDFKATHRGARIRGNGRKDPVQGGNLLELRLQGENVELDGDLRTALAALRLDSSWTSIEPRGRINCNIHVRLMDRSNSDRVFNPIDDLQMSMAFNGAAVRPNFFPCSFQDVCGAFRYLKGRLELERFAARHGSMQLSLPKAEVIIKPSGGYWAKLLDLRVTPFFLDADFIKALPPGLRSACEGLELKGKMKLYAGQIVIDEQPGPYLPRYLPGPRVANPTRTKPIDRLVGRKPDKPDPKTASRPRHEGTGSDFAQSRPGAEVAGGNEPVPVLPTIYWDGTLTMEGASTQIGVPWDDVHGKFACWGQYRGDRLGAVRGNLDVARAVLAKQPFQDIRAKLWVDPQQPELMQMDSITGKFFGGQVGGQGWVAMQTPVRYAMNLQATRIDLAEIAQHYQLGPKVHLEGLASAQFYLHNKIDERTGMTDVDGAGAIDVPNGKLLNLPFLLNLIKVAKLRLPDQTGFEEAHILFGLKGNRIKFGQLDLIGNAISLGGEGEMNADGSNMNLEFYPVWTKMKELFSLPGALSAEMSKLVFKIKVSGQLDGKVDYKSEPVPILVDPVRRVLEKMKRD